MDRLRSLAWALFVCGCGTPPVAEPDLDFRRAINAVAESRYDLARTYYEADLEIHPRRAESIRGLALAWLSGPDQGLQPAQALLEEYLAAVPEDGEIRRRYVRNLLLLGDWQRAQENAVVLPEGEEADLLRAEILAEVDPASAWRALEPYRESPNPRAQALAASIANRAGKKAAALEHAGRAVQMAPLLESSWYLLGRLQQGVGDRSSAERSLAVHRGLGKLARGGPQGGPMSATESLRLLSELEGDLPRDSATVAALSIRLRLTAGFVDSAVEDLPAVIDQLAGVEQLELAGLLLQRGQREWAETLFRRGLSAVPDSRRARAGLVASLLAGGVAEPGRFEAARELLTSGIEQDPYLARYHLLLGRLYQVAGDQHGAEASLTRALRWAPWNLDTRLELADLHLAAGDRLAAEQLLSRATESSPSLDAFRRARGLAKGDGQ